MTLMLDHIFTLSFIKVGYTNHDCIWKASARKVDSAKVTLPSIDTVLEEHRFVPSYSDTMFNFGLTLQMIKRSLVKPVQNGHSQ